MPRPPDAEAWGWRIVEGSEGDGEDEGTYPRPSGDRLGWVDEDAIYLIPSLAHRLVARTVADRGESFIVSDRTLREALERGRYLVPGNKGLRHNVWAEGRTNNTIRLSRAAVLAAWGPPNE